MRRPVKILPGTHPVPDSTQTSAIQFVSTSGVYSVGDKLASLPGWITGNTDYTGAARSVFGFNNGTYDIELIGTHSKLFARINGVDTNVTPLETVAAATLGTDPITTRYDDVQVTPFVTTNGSRYVIVNTFLYDEVKSGDVVTISGVVGSGGTLNGIPVAQINTTHTIIDVPGTYFRILVTTAATSSGSPTESGTVIAMKALKITYTAHGLAAGDRIKISGASGTIGGVPDTEMNKEHVISIIETANTFIVPCATAPSSLASGGGAGVEIFKEIDGGNISGGALAGFGGGDYDEGAYDEPKAFVSAFSYPRIWSFGKLGNDVILCPGDTAGVPGAIIYSWDGDIAEAPVKVTNSPTALWIYTKYNAIGALGAANVGNRIQHSDTTDVTIWSPSASNNAYFDDWEDVRRFISQATVGDLNVLFTEHEVVRESFEGPPIGYLHRTISTSDGLLGPKARIEIPGGVVFAGGSDFYITDGNSVTSLPGITCLEYIFGAEETGGGALNWTHRYKSFWRADPDRSLLFFHFPAGASEEPNQYMVYDLKKKISWLGERGLTAAEEPKILGEKPITVYGDGTTHELYIENSGVNAGSAVLNAYAESNWRLLGDGSMTQEIMEIYPDTTQQGNLKLTIYTKNYPQDTNIITWGPYTITPTTTFIDPQIEGVYVKYRWEKDELNTSFILGQWIEDAQPGTAI